MSDFDTNLKSLKSLLIDYESSRNPSLIDQASLLVKVNDNLVESGSVDSNKLSLYIPERRKFINIEALKHMEALRRKNALLNIEEDADHLIRLNEYIKVLLEEKAKPVDTLLSNLEYAESFLEESNRDMVKYKKRFFKCSTLKRIGKIFLILFVLVIIFIKIF